MRTNSETPEALVRAPTPAPRQNRRLGRRISVGLATPQAAHPRRPGSACRVRAWWWCSANATIIMPTYDDYDVPPQRIPRRTVSGNPTMKSVDIQVRTRHTMWYPEEATDLSAWYNNGTFELCYTMPDGKSYSTKLKPSNEDMDPYVINDKFCAEPEKLSTLLERKSVVLVTK